MNNINIAILGLVAVIVLGFIVGMVRENNMHTVNGIVNINRRIPPTNSHSMREKILLDEINRFMEFAEDEGVAEMLKEEEYIAVPAPLYYTLIAGTDYALYVNKKHPYIYNEYGASMRGSTKGRIRNTLQA